MKKSSAAHITAADSCINGQSSSNHSQMPRCDTQIDSLKVLGIVPVTLTIDPLSTPWFSEQHPKHFRSGCAPIMALQHAVELIQSGESAVLITADEPLKTGYSRDERHQLMAVYEGQETIADLYNNMAVEFCQQQSLTHSDFMGLADALFKNYQATYQLLIDQETAYFSMPNAQWYNHVTPLFRGVDCANPLMDFSGNLLLCHLDIVDKMELKHTINVAGVNCQELATFDEKQSIKQLAQYHHLAQAFTAASQQADIDFIEQYQNDNALLEVYTCYPVVPLAFLMTTGFIDDWHALKAWLKTHPITVTGGMNLARAPWNAPTLNALITMTHQLLAGEKQYALVHGNGGLGYRQGIAILRKG